MLCLLFWFHFYMLLSTEADKQGEEALSNHTLVWSRRERRDRARVSTTHTNTASQPVWLPTFLCLPACLPAFSILCLYRRSSADPEEHWLTEQVNLKRTKRTSTLYFVFPVWNSFEVKDDKAVEPLSFYGTITLISLAFACQVAGKQISVIKLNPNTG